MNKHQSFNWIWEECYVLYCHHEQNSVTYILETNFRSTTMWIWLRHRTMMDRRVGFLTNTTFILRNDSWTNMIKDVKLDNTDWIRSMARTGELAISAFGRAMFNGVSLVQSCRGSMVEVDATCYHLRILDNFIFKFMFYKFCLVTWWSMYRVLMCAPASCCVLTPPLGHKCAEGL